MSAGSSQLQPAGHETHNLVTGHTDDSQVIESPEIAARQAESDKLLVALDSKNLEEQAQARQLFFKHGHFDDVRRTLRTAESSVQRAAAARSLGIVGSRQATAHLIAALFDTAVDVRRAAAEALSRIGDPAVAPAPLRALAILDDLELTLDTAGSQASFRLQHTDWQWMLITAHTVGAVAFAISGALAIQFLVLPFWFGGLLGLTFYLSTCLLDQSGSGVLAFLRKLFKQSPL
ncbi:MAG TPA: HEAT repeat domain-containing protein [Pyrinomonadaceae bacterium]|nr:HEAT repeat domain-containing protein [Pyrinomonadaceae bacterium]